MPTFELTPQIMREIIMDHYSNPRHKGVPTGEGYKKVHTDSVNCIDDFDVYVKEEGGKIVDARWEGVACTISTASTDILCDRVIGMDASEAHNLVEQFMAMMRNSWVRNVKGMKEMAEAMAGIGRERQKNFLAYCQHLIRENFVYRFQAPELNYMNRDEATFSVRFSPFVNERNVFGLMEELELAERQITQNVNAKMVFFDLALRITVLIKK